MEFALFRGVDSEDGLPAPSPPIEAGLVFNTTALVDIKRLLV